MKLRLMDYTMTSELEHGMRVSNMAYLVAKELKLPEEQCRQCALAGLLHDVGKITLQDDVEGEDPLVIEEIRYIRQHPRKGYDMLKRHDYPEVICDAVLYHHENWDGSGYPENRYGEQIPLEACILRICDEFCEMIIDQPHRKAFSPEKAVSLLILVAKNFRLDVFLAFQRVLHQNPDGKLQLPEQQIDMRGELDQLWH